MSGIIGGAGSKSGVIGETELDYEEGVFTPVPNTGSIGVISQNRYRKIGGMCFIECYMGNVPSFTYITGLPFPTKPTGTGYENSSGTVTGNAANWHNNTVNISVYIYDNKIYFYQTLDDGNQTAKTSWDSGDDLAFSLSYMC